MKRILLATLICTLLLTGCTSTTQPENKPAPKPESTTAPEQPPAIDPGPVKLSIKEAGEYYLKIVCQANRAGSAFVDARNEREAEYLNGGSPRVKALREAAAEKVRLTRQTIELIDDEYYTWPGKSREPLLLVRKSDMSYLSAYQSIMNAKTYEEAYQVTFPELPPEVESAAQEVRYQLKLDADTSKSCKGYRKDNDKIYAEMLKRNELLGKSEASE